MDAAALVKFGTMILAFPLGLVMMVSTVLCAWVITRAPAWFSITLFWCLSYWLLTGVFL